MAGDERVIEVVIVRAAGEQKVPGLDAIDRIESSVTAGLVQSDDLAERVVLCDSHGRPGVVEV